MALYSGQQAADGYCVGIRCPPSDTRSRESTVTNAIRSRLGAEYRGRVHPALRARIRRWRTPAPRRQEQLVTVLVTNVEGRTEEIRSCLDSLVRSSYRNTEILVYIDGASRSIAAVVRSYARWDPRIKIVEQPTGSPPRLGSPSPNGHYLMVIKSCDRLETKAVARLVKVLRLSESDFAVGLDDDGTDGAFSTSADAARLHRMERLGLTLETCPDHPAPDSMSGKLFRHGFLTDLGWTVDVAPTIDERALMDRAYQWGRFDLVTQRVLRRQDADGSQVPSRSQAKVTTRSADSLSGVETFEPRLGQTSID